MKIYEQDNIIDYQSYVLKENPDLELTKEYLQLVSIEIATYVDAIPVSEHQYFIESVEMRVEGYASSNQDTLDTEESRQSYFLKSNRQPVRRFF